MYLIKETSPPSEFLKKKAGHFSNGEICSPENKFLFINDLTPKEDSHEVSLLRFIVIADHAMARTVGFPMTSAYTDV